LTTVVTALVSLLFTGIFIKLGTRYGWGKRIREEGPQEHLAKAGTPTMGGIAFLLAAAIAWFVFGETREGTAIVMLMLAAGLLGLVDDLIALRRMPGADETTGLLARWRILFQVAIGAAFALDAFNAGHVLTGTMLLDVFLYTFVIVGSINALNMTDGLDGLAAGVMVIMLLAFLGQSLAPILIGALLGFLWYNGKPARVFMGGVGSEALGAGLAGFAILSGTVWFLPLLALIPVAITLSVIAQVSYFKLTGGKRLLKMTPLHHHFELSGMSEEQITMRFWLVTAAACALTVWLIRGVA